jgi:hypothetical protein
MRKCVNRVQFSPLFGVDGTECAELRNCLPVWVRWRQGE